MHELLTAVNEATSLVRIVSTTVLAFAAFISRLHRVHESVQALHDELATLQGTVRAIHTWLQGTPGLANYGDSNAWSDIRDSMHKCCETVEVFAATFQGLETHSGNHSFLSDAVRTARLNWKESNLATLRAQFHSHNSSLLIFISMMNLQITINTSQPTLNGISKKMDELKNLIGKSHEHDTHMSEELGVLVQTNERIRASAKTALSNATVILGSRSTQANSEYGEDYDNNTFINEWRIQSAPGDLDLSVSSRREPSHVTPQAAPDHVGQVDVGVETITRAAYNHRSSLLPTYLQMGDGEYEKKHYSKAEVMFKRALGIRDSLGPNGITMNRTDVVLKIALACFEQDKLEEAKDLCMQVKSTSTTVTEQLQDRQVLEACYTLAQILYRQSAFEAAVEECYEFLAKHAAVKGRDGDFYNAISLLVSIHENQGDELEALANSALIPQNFERPTFRRPLTKGTTDIELLVVPNNSDSGLGSCDHSSSQSGTTGEPANTARILSPIVETLSRQSQQNTRQSAPTAVSSRRSISSRTHSDTSDSSPVIERRSSRTSPTPWRPSIISGIAETLLPRRTSSLELFFSAVQSGDIAQVRAYLNGSRTSRTRGADGSLAITQALNHDKLDALHLAAKAGQQAVLELLLERGAPPDRNCDIWGTLLHVAARYGHLSTVEYLLKSGADVDAVTQTRGHTPLQLAARDGHEEVVEYLVLRGAKVNHGAPQRALHFAAERGMLASVRVLVEKGADLDALNRNQHTALAVAARNGQYDVVEYLVGVGARMELRDEPRETTALGHAIRRGRAGIVGVLLDHHADADGADALGLTPLHLAAEHGHVEIVDLLLRSGALPNSLDRRGRTPLQLAMDAARADVANTTPSGLAKKAARAEVVKRLTLAVGDGRDRVFPS